MLPWIESHPGLAAWVQAIGTILAVLAAILFPMFERRRVERAAADVLARDLEALLANLFDAARGLESGMKTKFDARLVDLEAAPLDRMDGRLAVFVRDLRKYVRALAEISGADPALVGIRQGLVFQAGAIIEILARMRRVNGRLVDQNVLTATRNSIADKEAFTEIANRHSMSPV